MTFVSVRCIRSTGVVKVTERSREPHCDFSCPPTTRRSPKHIVDTLVWNPFGAETFVRSLFGWVGRESPTIKRGRRFQRTIRWKKFFSLFFSVVNE